MILLPPAKINLTLDVGFRREDGYHEIETVFQAVDLRDELRLERRRGPSLPPENLVMRALHQLAADEEWSVGLTKHIPERAGLGGGSSDAAAALIGGLCALRSSPSRAEVRNDEVALQKGGQQECGLVTSRDLGELQGLARLLGSDVPFFLLGGAAYAKGRGEILEPLPDLPVMWFCLAKPSHGISTTDAFQLLDRNEGRKVGSATRHLVDAWSRISSPKELAPYLSNDFEHSIRKVYAEVDALIEEMERRGCLARVLCGSGSAVAGLCREEAEARDLAHSLESVGYWARAVRTLLRAEWP